MTPPPFRLLPGAPGSPVLLHVPHGSRRIPDGVRRGIVLDDAALERELDHITDAHTADLAARAARGVRAAQAPWRFVNNRSRLVVDPERFPDEREEMLTAGMGAVYTRTTQGERLRGPDGPTDDQERLLDAYFRPYAAAMTRAVDQRLAATGRCVLIDVHSYPTRALPYELHGDGPRPPVCLGTDPFHTPPDLLARAEAAFARFGGTGVDSPFAGAYVPLKHHGRDSRVQALMIEIRRDQYLTEPGGPAGPGLALLADALAVLVESLDR